VPGCCGLVHTLTVDPIHDLLIYSIALGGYQTDYIETLRIQTDESLLYGRAIRGLLLPRAVTLDPSYQFV
jgi:hypothetical protein